MPRSRAVVTASVRSSTASLPRMLLTNHLAVPLAMSSACAISTFVRPLAMSFNTSISRGVQAGSRAPIRELARHFGRDPPQARVHRPDGGHELKGRRALEQVGLGPGAQGLMDVLVAVIDGQRDEPALQELRTDGLH